MKTKSVELSYGIKFHTLGRYLQWPREHDPGAKSTVFSQYRKLPDVPGDRLAYVAFSKSIH